MEDLLPVTSTEDLPVACSSGGSVEERREFCFSVSLCSIEIFELEGGKGATISSCAVSRGFILDDFRLLEFLQVFKPTMVIMFWSERTCIPRRHIEVIRQRLYLVSS
jgi:hypothetical protein